MLLILRDEHSVPLGYRGPFPLMENFTASRVEKDFVLPVMGVEWRVSFRPQLENAHAEIECAVVFSDQNPARDAFCGSTVKGMCRCFPHMNDFHDMNFFLKSSQGAKAAKRTAEIR